MEYSHASIIPIRREVITSTQNKSLSLGMLLAVLIRYTLFCSWVTKHFLVMRNDRTAGIVILFGGHMCSFVQGIFPA